MKTNKLILKAFFLISLAIHCLIYLIPANADVMTRVNVPCFPEAGKLETHGSLTIDHSNASDGYIIVKAPKSSQALKIAISFDGTAKQNLKKKHQAYIMQIKIRPIFSGVKGSNSPAVPRTKASYRK